MTRYRDWLRQAENDMQWATCSFKENFFSQTCFIAQQAAEKALKAYCFFKGFDTIRTHSLFQIIQSLGENGQLEQLSKELDLYYISSRYPDAFPAGAPFELITRGQAQKAIEAASIIVRTITKRINDGQQTSGS